MYDINELEDRIEYELWTLEFIREKLFDQSNRISNNIKFVLGDYLPNGNLRKHTTVNITESIGASAVKTTLAQMRPLLFNAAFKIQDMVVEWILNENSIDEWHFSVKIREFRTLKNNNTLTLPQLFTSNQDLLNAFFLLYQNLESIRGSIIHSGQITVSNNGTISGTDRTNHNYNFTNQHQSSYVRFVCISLKLLLNQLNNENYYLEILKNDLAILQPYHSLTIFEPKDIYLTKVQVIVPKEEARSLKPFVVEINIEEIIASIESQFPSEGEKEVFFPLNIIADLNDVTLEWNIPSEEVPFDNFTLDESDSKFIKYLTRQIK